MQRFVFAAALVAVLCPCGRAPAALRSGIIPQTTAARHGLTRPWFTQIQLDRGRARIGQIVLFQGTLYVQTNRAMLHAIDAETGQTLWAKQVGRSNHPSLTPGLGHDLLAVINGSRLYVCNRYNGNLLYEVQVDGVPGAGSAVSKKWAYVPMVNGLVMAYRLRQEYVPPLACQSLGRALVQPLVTRQTEGEEFVAWPTDRGYLNIARVDLRAEDRLALKYRLETDAGIAARPTYQPPDPKDAGASGVIFAASRDGFVYAIQEKNGELLWRFSAGEPILQPVVVIGNRVYAATQPGGICCISAQTGGEVWWAPNVIQFIAAGKQQVYVADKLGRILVLSAETGTRLDTIDATTLSIKLTNARTDRLYLATDTGLIQCLHELEQSEPIHYGRPRKKTPKKERKPVVQQQGPQPPEPAEKPGTQEKPVGGEQDPFGSGDDDEDPFA